MAGLGRKNFTREVLTSADVNGFLMDQTVMVFASAAARDVALPSPTPGMHCYLADSGMRLYRSPGGIWVRTAAGGYLANVTSDAGGNYIVPHGLGVLPRWVNITAGGQSTEALNAVIKLLVVNMDSSNLVIRTYRHDGTSGAAYAFSTLFNAFWAAGL
jgi:hypothetical protein